LQPAQSRHFSIDLSDQCYIKKRSDWLSWLAPATGFNPAELPVKGKLFGSIPKPVSSFFARECSSLGSLLPNSFSSPSAPRFQRLFTGLCADAATSFNIAAFQVTVVYMYAIVFSADKREDLQVPGRRLLKTSALGWDD
jgi:hypothetical protein